MINKIKSHKEKNQRVRIFRQVAKGVIETSNGYILDFSEELLLIHESDDFKVDGYAVIPIDQIKKIRFNKSDRYFDKIMKWEKEIEKVGINYTVNLKNWKALFSSLQQKVMNVVVECEDPDIKSFTIGLIEKIGKIYIY